MIGELLGHRKVQTTARYAHLARDSVRESTARVAESIGADILPEWLVVRKRAGLEDVRIHDLRHSFASRALALGESLTMIGKLLGHRQVQTTARYAHLARESVKTSAARVAGSISADMEKPCFTSV